jgi:hypothetical protein
MESYIVKIAIATSPRMSLGSWMRLSVSIVGPPWWQMRFVFVGDKV